VEEFLGHLHTLNVRKAIVDAEKLVIGQEVCLTSGGGAFVKTGKVVEVTQCGGIVQLSSFEGPVQPEGPELIRFDTNGKACDSSDIHKGNLWGSDPRIPGTHEGGPWELTDSLYENL